MKQLQAYSWFAFFMIACGDNRHYLLGPSLNGGSHPRGTEEPVREDVKYGYDDGEEGGVDVPPLATINGELDVLAIVDTRVFPNVTVEDLAEKLALFDDLTQTHFNVHTNIVSPLVFTSSAEDESDLDFADRVIYEYRLPYPEYIILFSYGDTGDGRLYGGYFTGRIEPSGRYCNEFQLFGDNSRVPVAVLDLEHLFARCGYDDETMEHVSPTSSDGECRGVDGVSCVWTGDYFACEDRLGEPNLDQDRFIAWGIVHEFLHNWGSSHVCTRECEAELGSCDIEVELSDEFSQSPCTIVGFLNSFASCK